MMRLLRFLFTNRRLDEHRAADAAYMLTHEPDALKRLDMLTRARKARQDTEASLRSRKGWATRRAGA